MAMQGETVEIELDENACAAEAADTIRMLDAFNAQIDQVQNVVQLATPSASACRWCQFKALCPAFWNAVDNTWTELGTGALKGVLDQDPIVIHNAHAFAISMEVTSGTTRAGQINLAPLERTIFPEVAGFHRGERVRIINLRNREDGQVLPTLSTVCLRESDCPEFSPPKDNQ